MAPEEKEIIESATQDDIPDVGPENNPEAKQAEQPQYFIYYLTKITVAYKRDNAMRTRSVNILARSDTPGMNRALLNQIQHNAIGRVMTENEVKESQMRDVIVDSIMILGQFTEEEFLSEQGTVINTAPSGSQSGRADEPAPDNHTEIPAPK